MSKPTKSIIEIPPVGDVPVEDVAEVPAVEPEEEDPLAGFVAPVQVVTVDPLYGFDEEPTKESNNVLDEPDVPFVAPLGGGEPEPGLFVGLGVTHVSKGGSEWFVDPDTGCVTGPA